MMMANLTDTQMYTLMQHSRMLDDVALCLSPQLQQQLKEFEVRNIETYAAGEWTNQTTGEKRVVPFTVTPPTEAEARELFGKIYLELDAKRGNIQGLMTAMGLPPKALHKGFVSRVIENMQGWFR